jgi:hypothetical protein
MKIKSITIVHKIDVNPDLSYLGRYTDTYTRGCIDREAIGSMRINEYRYFKPEDDHWRMGAYRRYEDYCKNKWFMMLIGTEAVCEIKVGNKWIEHKEQCFTGGIESDSGEEFIEETEKVQLHELRFELSELGFSSDELDEAFKHVERKEL